MSALDILFQSAAGDAEAWLAGFQAALPQARLRVWRDGDDAPADYAIVWKPPAAMLRGRTALKAIFNLGAGVDAILDLGDALPPGVPVVRLDDAGMGAQMGEYVAHAVLRHFRRFDAYAAQAAQGLWKPLPPRDRRDFTVGILGLGVLGTKIAQALAPFGFRLTGWSRTPKAVPGVACHAGADGLDAFLHGANVLVCVLPLTAGTRGILNRDTLGKLPRGGYVVNVARGAHVVEDDLLALVRSGHLAGAALDVFAEEPLPPNHPFRREPNITITPHIAALTLRDESIAQIAGKIAA
ncbi:MAG: 2-hydroxyacid dehydrogenase, partial [Burkholderiaceae bacterium]